MGWCNIQFLPFSRSAFWRRGVWGFWETPCMCEQFQLCLFVSGSNTWHCCGYLVWARLFCSAVAEIAQILCARSKPVIDHFLKEVWLNYLLSFSSIWMIQRQWGVIYCFFKKNPARISKLCAGGLCRRWQLWVKCTDVFSYLFPCILLDTQQWWQLWASRVCLFPRKSRVGFGEPNPDLVNSIYLLDRMEPHRVRRWPSFPAGCSVARSDTVRCSAYYIEGDSYVVPFWVCYFRSICCASFVWNAKDNMYWWSCWTTAHTYYYGRNMFPARIITAVVYITLWTIVLLVAVRVAMRSAHDWSICACHAEH